MASRFASGSWERFAPIALRSAELVTINKVLNEAGDPGGMVIAFALIHMLPTDSELSPASTRARLSRPWRRFW